MFKEGLPAAVESPAADQEKENFNQKAKDFIEKWGMGVFEDFEEILTPEEFKDFISICLELKPELMHEYIQGAIAIYPPEKMDKKKLERIYELNIINLKRRSEQFQKQLEKAGELAVTNGSLSAEELERFRTIANEKKFTKWGTEFDDKSKEREYRRLFGEIVDVASKELGRLHLEELKANSEKRRTSSFRHIKNEYYKKKEREGY
ncbi:MAG: hypothetical protein NT116_01870 [Candidatus Parcubacteria bacterium]|nr:hypothetical protein [Candidatus Parcubacteria bacterium]